MEFYFLLIVILLILLALSDLIVGVSNDAVNFLNSSIGAKVAPFWVIMVIAALGILVGATFSSGMMEVARKGIFHPENFGFSEIMVIFLAVMITDIILLDFFNTLGLPTSTTVSIVFELLGAAVAIAMIKIMSSGASFSEMNNYINTSSALLIITGILLSVVVAFSIGMIIQFVVRMVFSFNIKQSYKYFGALWGGIAISSITYFILIKGAKGSSFLTAETVSWIQEHSIRILLFSFIGWTIVLQLLHWLFRVNILRLIVLVGTFALAMAFAGNDLVNFIGVPIAGIESFNDFTASGMSDPGAYAMTSLQGKVKTPTLFLLIAGAVMVFALWTSKKARSVTATEINLGRQDAGYERFESSAVARGIVRGTIGMNRLFYNIVPAGIRNRLQHRFDQKPFMKLKEEQGVSFDMIRASVNLVVASALISFATSLKLPLSTTYVTFMVAMGTSLADGAWGRESAVYRVSGVVTVIGGWFFTAFCAFTVSFLLAMLINWGQIFVVILLIPIIVLVFIKTYRVHKKRSVIMKNAMEETGETELTGFNIMETCNSRSIDTFNTVSKLYSDIIEGYSGLKRKKVKKVIRAIKELNDTIKNQKNNIHSTIEKLKEDDIETGHHYVQVIDYLSETGNCLKYIAQPVFEYIDNNHPPLLNEQKKELAQFDQLLSEFFKNTLKLLTEKEFDATEKIIEQQQELIEQIDKLRKKQIKRIKRRDAGTKNSLLYLSFLNESKNLLLHAGNLVKSQRDFMVYNNINNGGGEVLEPAVDPGSN